MSNIIIINASEGNLKNVTVEIPRNKLTVITGLSGSGKSTLAIDVLYQECQRQYLEAIGYQGIHKPKVDAIKNVSPAIRITQNESNKNPRSTVGTLTNLYTDLRMIYEKLAVRQCPSCKEHISAAECKEETEKIDGDFKVYMYCVKCGFKMDKLTRSHFSYNTREGACKTCQGIGKTLEINTDTVIHEDLTLENGAIDFWEQQYKDYQITSFYNALKHYDIPVLPNTAIKDYSDIQKMILLNGIDCIDVKTAFAGTASPQTVIGGKFEGVLSTLWRRMSDTGGDSKQIRKYFSFLPCVDCGGERLNELSRSVTVEGTRIPELSAMAIDELYDWITALVDKLDTKKNIMINDYLLDTKTKMERIMKVGLGYLSLDRTTITLSGGEMQRIKLAAALDSSLTGVIYILDEPTIGLHPHDTAGMINVLKKLRDLENTVVIIEHDTEVMTEADFIIDIGPGSGKNGGEIVAAGVIDDIKSSEQSETGKYLSRSQPLSADYRHKNGEIIISNANLYNLQNVNVTIPTGCLVTVTGVSGSGKSTLVFDVLSEGRNVTGLDRFKNIISVDQTGATRMKRSNVATYSDVYTEVRKIFGGLRDSSALGLTAKHFSFNTIGGRCENCEGMGYITSNMLFFENIDVICPVCDGNRFNETVLSIKYNGYSINDVLKLSVDEALSVFGNHSKANRILQLLRDVGLGYLELGQALTTLSGGEGQRLKLAKELLTNQGHGNLYLMDEPTVGLHPIDVDNFLVLLNRMIDSGNSVIVVEHNQQIIKASDWIIDLGPGGGKSGGRVIFEGTPIELIKCGNTLTAECLRKSSLLPC